MSPDVTAGNQYAQLQAAVLGGQQAGGGLDIVGNSPEMAKLYGALNPSPALSQQVQGAAYNAQVQDANAKTAAAAKLKEENAMSDPSKYQRIPLSDGGFKFIAPNGQEISANQYAQITNKTPAEVLNNSQNPIDKSFQQDYKQLNQYIQDKQNLKGAKVNADGTTSGDVSALRRAQAVEAQVKQQYGIDLAKENPQEVIKTFMNAYPTVFGLHTTGPQGTGYLLPSSDSVKSYVNTNYPGQ